MALSDVDWSRVAWWSIGLALGTALAFVVYSFVGTFVFGVFIYYAARPVYGRIRQRIPQPSVAAAVAIFAMVLPALLLVGYAFLIVVNQIQELDIADVAFLDRLPLAEVDLDAIADPARFVDPTWLVEFDWMQYVTADTLGSAVGSIGQAAGTLVVLGTAVIHLFVMLALAFYLLRDGSKLARFFTRYADSGGVLEAYGSAVDRDLRSIFFGNILNAIVTGTIAVIVYSVLNVFAPPEGAIPAAALIGALAGVASLVPIVGMKLVYVPVALFMALRAIAMDATAALGFVALFALASFVIVDTIPDLVLRPYVSGRSLHVGAVMLAYTLGPLLFGWYGIFLMPTLLVLIVHFAGIVLPELLAGEPLRPYAVDPTHLVEEPPSDATPADDLSAASADGAADAAGEPEGTPPDRPPAGSDEESRGARNDGAVDGE